jgi:hypothetical protein
MIERQAMSPYIHHVPGRLRVKCAVLRNAPAHAQRIETALRCTPGVLSAETNLLTGSIIVRYSVERTNGDNLLEKLNDYGLISAAALQEQKRSPAVVSNLATPLAEAVVEKLMGVLIQRSAAALIGAIL